MSRVAPEPSEAPASTGEQPAQRNAAGEGRARHFSTDHLLGDLKGRSVRGGAVTVTAQALKFAMNLGSTMVLARLLAPADFGLVAMVTAVTGFVAMFKDAGLSMATVQRREITHEQVSTLFWINIALSVLVMLTVAALAPAIAWFYGEPSLVWITLALAGTFVFAGLTVQHQALLRRQMRFKALAVVEVGSMAGGVGVAVTMATLGFGYWSLVGLIGGTTVANCALVWLLSGWRPGLPRRGSGVRPMLGFGGNITGFNVVNYFARNADNMLIGWWWGAGSLGIYAKAYGLLLQPLQQFRAPISAVIMPTLSRMQDDPERYTRAGLRVLRMTATLGVPLVVLVGVFADEIVWIVLGRGWEDAIPVVRWLCVAGVVQLATSQIGSMFMSQGRADLMLRQGVVVSVMTVLAFAIGLPWGAAGVAAAYALTWLLIHLPMQFAFLAKGGRFTQRQLYAAVGPAVAVGLLAMSGAMAIRLRAAPVMGDAMTLPTAAAALLAVYAVGYASIPGCRRGVLELWEAVSG